MLVKLFAFVFFLVLGVRQGFGIKCYSCSAPKDTEGCFRLDRNRVPLTECNFNALNVTKNYAKNIDYSFEKIFDLDIHHLDPQLAMNCLKQVTKVGEREIVLRGCQLAATDQTDICRKLRKINQDTVRTTYCTLCNNDGCNHGHHIRLSIAAVLCVVFTFAIAF